jgi:hypothetical protein
MKKEGRAKFGTAAEKREWSKQKRWKERGVGSLKNVDRKKKSKKKGGVVGGRN